MVGITAKDYLGSVKILWEWLELQPVTTWDQWRYSGNGWSYMQWLTGISGDTLGMVGITANDYLGSVEILRERLELQTITTWDQWLISGQCWLRGWEQLCTPSHGSHHCSPQYRLFQPWPHWLLLFSARDKLGNSRILSTFRWLFWIRESLLLRSQFRSPERK